MIEDSPLPRVTICVPVYNGAQWVAELLVSVRDQTFTDFEVLISDDASTDTSADICRELVCDPRFRLVVQPERLGWMENCNWMLRRARGEFVLIHGHDDVLEASCIATLLAHMNMTPSCCVAFADMQAFGTEDHVLSQASITGGPFERAYDVMAHHYNAIAFSGLIRSAVARSGLRGNDHDNFAADSTWLMRLARAGELHRVGQARFRKRFHAGMSHFQWTRWDDDRKIGAWGAHCADVLDEALSFDLTAAQQWLLVWSALQRLLLAAANIGPYSFIRDLALDRKAAMVSAFLAAMSDRLREHRCAAGDLPMTAGTARSIADALAAPYANLTDQLRQSEAERARERGQNATLTSWLAEANADRASSHQQIEQLAAWLNEANADRSACHGQIEQLSNWLKEANADRELCHRKLAEQASRVHLPSFEAARTTDGLAMGRASTARWARRLGTQFARLRAIFT